MAGGFTFADALSVGTSVVATVLRGSTPQNMPLRVDTQSLPASSLFKDGSSITKQEGCSEVSSYVHHVLILRISHLLARKEGCLKTGSLCFMMSLNKFSLVLQTRRRKIFASPQETRYGP